MTPSKKVEELLDRIKSFGDDFQNTIQKIAKLPGECKEKERLLEALHTQTYDISKDVFSFLSDVLKMQNKL